MIAVCVRHLDLFVDSCFVAIKVTGDSSPTHARIKLIMNRAVYISRTHEVASTCTWNVM